jgi:hypothetical protein
MTAEVHWQRKVKPPNATDVIDVSAADGDADDRFTRDAAGKMEFGGGTTAVDVVLERIEAGVWGPTTGQIVSRGVPIVNCTTSTLTVTAASHAGRIITLNRAAGIAVTLPAATGTGNVYTFIVGTTFTANGTIAVASNTDYMRGRVYTLSDGAAAVLGYSTSNSGTVATESDTITLYTASSNTTGGIIGDVIVLRDIGTAVWHVLGHTQSGGTEATPFSAAV